MWWRALGVLCWAHCVCVSRTAVCGVLGEGVLRGYVVWLCIWRVLLVYCAVCCVNESTRQWGVPECGHSHKRHAHLGPGSEKGRVAGVSLELTKTCPSGRARWATLLPDSLAGIPSA